MTPDELIQRYGSPLYVYDEAVLRARCRELRRALVHSGVVVFYAMKANSNPALLRVIGDEGLLLDAVSRGEVHCALQAGFKPTRISFNGNNVTAAELEAVAGLGVHVTVDSLSQLETWGERFPESAVGVRINPDVGDGHHPHVITGGPDSKFGIDEDHFEGILEIASRYRLRIDGIHHHIGSGILTPEPFLYGMEVILRLARRLPDLEFIDFGGGFGVPYRPEDVPFDLGSFATLALPRLECFREEAAREIEFRFEPGRFVVAACGTLYVTVTGTKTTRRHTFVGTDSGFNHLLRPALYGSHHEVQNLSNPDGERQRVRVAGNICESGDLLAVDRELPECRVGDLLAIRDAGAYGFSMASTYNLRSRPAEVLLSGDTPRLIRRRETLDDLLSTCEW